MKDNKLTEKQKQILDIVKRLIAKNGYPPTVREIGAKAHLSSPATTHFHLNKLAEKGYIDKGNNKNRTLKLLVPNEYVEEKEDNLVEVPLLGKVTAGIPIEAIETPDEYFPLPAELVAGKKDIFTLKVSGESMINAGILDGDLAVVEQASTAQDGQIIVAVIDDAITLKRYYKEAGRVRLQPENPDFPAIYSTDVRVVGILSNIVRTY